MQQVRDDNAEPPFGARDGATPSSGGPQDHDGTGEIRDAADLLQGEVGLGRIVFDSMAEGLVIADETGRVVVMNRSAERLLGPDACTVPLDEWATHLDIRLHDGVTECAPADFPLVRALRGEPVAEMELFVRGASGRGRIWITGGAQPLRHDDRLRGAVMVFRDVSTRKRAERALREERLRRQQLDTRQTAIAEIDMSIHEAHRLFGLLDRVADLTRQLVPAHGAHVKLSDPEIEALLVGADPSTLRAASAEFEPPAAAVAWIVENAQPLTVGNVADDPFRLEPTTSGEVRAYAGIPLIDADAVVGILFAFDREPRHYAQDELDVMARLAERTATCISKVRLYERLRGLNDSLHQRTSELAENERRFRTLADTAPVLIWMSGPDGGLTYVNRFWLDFTGRQLEDETGRGWIQGVHPDDRERCRRVHDLAFTNHTPFRMEVRLRRHDDAYRWLLTTGTPRIGPDDRFLGFIGSSVDISDHREIQAELARHRKQLETLVDERTTALEDSHRQLRQADRLASIGTLTAGLGHDMNNVLFPVRCRLDALDWDAVDPDLMDVLQSVAHAVAYLQQLTDGLRLFALDPDDADASASLTSVRDWWEQISPLITKALPRNVRLESVIDADLPSVRVAPHRLTQALLNLVVNAGEAMPDGGHVQITARTRDDGKTVHIAVRDEGQGMTPQVRLAAFDPFFTTKTRGLSTGLGLSLVHGVVTSSRGTIDVETAPGAGTTMTLSFPAAPRVVATPRGGHATGRGRAAVHLADRRLAAWIGSLLRVAGYRVDPDADPELEVDGAVGDDPHTLWVTDAAPDRVEPVRRFLERPGRRVMALGPVSPDWERPGVTIVEEYRELEALRKAIDSVSAGVGDDH